MADDAKPAPGVTDAVKLVAELDPEQIRERLHALEGERQALLVLLRSANAVERGRELGRKMKNKSKPKSG